MKFNELDRVKVLRDFSKEDVHKGDVGVVVFAFTQPHEAYEVEFDDGFGKPKATFPIFPEDLEKVFKPMIG